MGVSLRPTSFAAGGGLLDDADVTITRARFAIGYGSNNTGGQGQDATTLHLVLTDGDDTQHDQFYSCGNGFVPSETGDEETSGKELVPVGDKTAPSGSSNMAMVVNSLVNAGLPEDLLDSGDISAIEGVKGHVMRVPEPKRAGLPAREGKNAGREKTVLIFTTVTGLPGDAKAAKAKPATTGKGPQPVPAKAGTAKATTAAAVEANDDLKDELAGHLYTVLADAPDGLKKVALVPALFKIIDKLDPNRKELLAMAGKNEVISSIDGLEFDGTTLKMA